MTRLVIFVAFEEKESVERAMIQFNHAELGPARDRVVAKRLQDKKDDRYEVAYLLNEMFKVIDIQYMFHRFNFCLTRNSALTRVLTLLRRNLGPMISPVLGIVKRSNESLHCK